jgi:2-keto-4-pentenoate hydratase/2-oxohepta-3-ene-1,7-dioic acid hydratase in catechol pathway
VRLVSFIHRGRPTYGVAIDDARFADVGALLGERHATLRSVLETGAIDALTDAASAAPIVDGAGVEWLAPLPDARRIFCIGINYRAHREEMGRDASAHPTVFVRWSSSVVGDGVPIVRPRESTMLDFEGELAVVIGRPGRRIAPGAALEHVLGYSCFQDGSVRDFQRHTSQFTAGKNFDRSGAFGPSIVTADDVADPSRLTLTTRVNGAVMQQATTDLLIFDVPELIAYLSSFTELRPGDVIATGTPGGVGVARTPPVFLCPGDTVEVEIPGIGTLRNTVIDEERP